MSATAVQPLFEFLAAERPGGEEPVLEELISGVWEELLRRGTASCPVCHGPMERTGERGRCGRCGRCGSVLG